MTEFNGNAETATKSLIQLCNDYATSKTSCIFSIDGRNGQLSQRKVCDAIAFLQKYGFVCITPDLHNSDFKNDMQSLLKAINSTQPAGHAFYDFLSKKHVNSDDASSQLEQTITDEIHDFEPSAVSHCQSAWNLRCNKVLRQFFAQLYQAETPRENFDVNSHADRLIPSIEKLLDLKKVLQPVDERKKKVYGALSLPTFYYNPTWTRAPHVIAAYHLYSHFEQIQSYYNEYEQQVLSMSDEQRQKNVPNPKEEKLFYSRIQQKWLQRVKREIVATAKKVIIGKRATNKMVQDAAFNTKKSAEVENAQTDAESIRPLLSTYDATIIVGNGNENSSICYKLVPGFQNFYTQYLCCKRFKWAQLSGDAIAVGGEEDDFGEKLFKNTAVTVDIPAGSIFIVNRNVPRWIAERKLSDPFWVLPISYRIHAPLPVPIVTGLFSDSLIGNDHTVLHAAKICPFEVACAFAYQKSIRDGIVYSSLPHLTGASYFSRSTKKTALDMNQKRIDAYQKWIADPKNKHQNVEYVPPILPEYLQKLLSVELVLLKSFEKQLETVEKTLAAQQEEIDAGEVRAPNKKRKVAKDQQQQQCIFNTDSNFSDNDTPTDNVQFADTIPQSAELIAYSEDTIDSVRGKELVPITCDFFMQTSNDFIFDDEEYLQNALRQMDTLPNNEFS